MPKITSEKQNLKLKLKKHKIKIIIVLISVTLIGAVAIAIATAGPISARVKKTWQKITPSKQGDNKATTTKDNKATNGTTTTTTTAAKTSGQTTKAKATIAINNGSVSVNPSPISTTTIPFLNSLVGYWKLNGNASGALGKDDGSIFGNINYVAGKFGLAAHFNGSSYIEIPDRDYFSPATFGQRMTVSFWFKPDTYNFPGVNEGYVNFLGKTDWTNGAKNEWEFRLDNETAYDGFSRSERMNFYAFNQGGGLGAGSALNKACPLNLWTHVVGELDSDRTKLYINGKLVDSDLLSDYGIQMSNTGAPLRIGTTDKDSFLKGSISNLMIYNRALNDSEVNQLFLTDLSK